MTGTAAVTTNSPATGQPTITGTAEVGETLTAGTSAISDDNGLTNAVFSYQWVLSANGADTDITDATASSYVVTNAEIDKAIKVRVNFTDDDGYSETLTSNATTSVPVPEPVIVPPDAPQIAQAAGDAQVPDTWALIPTGLGVGDSFRLLFLSSLKRNPQPTAISTYNTWIQERAEAGHDDIQDYSDGFTVVGCTEDDDARDNTSTTFTSTDKGVPIYWLNGNKVADEYEDFYDGGWDNEANDKNQHGNNGPNTSLEDNYPATGCDDNGTELTVTVGGTTQSRALGSSHGVTVGRPHSTTFEAGPLSSGSQTLTGNNHPFYGLSAVFTIVAAATDATLSDLELQDASDDSTILSNRSFVAATTDYTASVTRDVDEITIIPTLNDGDDSYEIQDATGTALADADMNQNEFQVALPLGTTIINVKVTTADGNTTVTYTVAVTRALTEILSARLTVGQPTSGKLGFLQGLFGSLSDKTFSFTGTNYTITELAFDPDTDLLIFAANRSFNQKAKDLLVLKLDSTSLHFTDGGSAGDRRWTAPLSWSPGNRVDVTIATPALPSVPADLGATAISIDQVDLLWQPPDDDGDTEITGYRIEVSDDEGGTWTNLRSNTKSVETTYSHTAVPPGTTLHYRVSAINGLGTGAHSDVAYATTDAGTEIWSPTVTVGLISSNTYSTLSSDETFGYSASDSIGSINDATFMVGNTEYTVEVVSSYGLTSGSSIQLRAISLDIDQALPTDATIAWYLTGESYRLEEATVDEDDNSYRFFADADSQALAWSAGDTVSMSLAIATPDPTLSGLSVNDGTNDLTLNVLRSRQRHTTTRQGCTSTSARSR